MVGDEPLLQGVGVVIGSLNERFARDVILHVVLGRVEDLVIGSSRGRVYKSSGDTGNEEAIVDLKFDGMLKLLLASGEHVV